MKVYAWLAVMAIVATGLWHVSDYGSVKTELEASNDKVETLVSAETERIEMETIESKHVADAIDNNAIRKHYTEQLEQQAADYEKALATARTTACNLSHDTIASMQHFAKAGSPRKQLEKHTRVSVAFATHEPGGTERRHSIRDGGFVFHQRGPVLGCSLQPDRPATGSKVTPEAVAAT